MLLRLPDSASLVGSLLGTLGGTTAPSTGDWTTDAATPEQLDEALAALARGDIEYVILEDGEDFLQVAGEGDGPYQVQVSEQSEMREIARGMDAAAMGTLAHAYLRADASWRDAGWTPMA